MKNLIKKLRYLTRQIRYLSIADIEERFFIFLEDIHGRQEKIHCTVSKKDIAASIGTTPESLSRLLARLKARGVCTWEGEYINIDPAVWKNRTHRPGHA
jgi:CRP-like cAMP-binding protein